MQKLRRNYAEIMQKLCRNYVHLGGTTVDGTAAPAGGPADSVSLAVTATDSDVHDGPGRLGKSVTPPGRQ